METKKITVLYECQSPLSHMMGVSGNEAIINREPVITNFGKRWVPVISGNAIRHCLIREAGVNHLRKLIGIEKFRDEEIANFFYNGGNLTESATVEAVEKVKEIWEKLPLIKLLGGSLRNQILTGMMLVGRGTMLCEENKSRLEKILDIEYQKELPEIIMSAELFIGSYQYTRGDVRKQKQDVIDKTEKGLLNNEGEKVKSNLMLYSGQNIISGALFVSEFLLQDISDLEFGSFFSAIKYWQENDGTLGGSARIGHGKVCIDLLTDIDVNKYISCYEDYMRSQSDVVEFINNLFPVKEKKNAKS